MIGGLLMLAVLGAAGYGISRLVSGRQAGAPGGGDVRRQVVRFFRLALLFGALVLVAEGVAGLITEVVPRGTELSRDPATLARALAFTVVGVPVLGGLVSWQRRSLRADPDEERSDGWNAYLTVVLGVSLLLAVGAANDVLAWAVGAGEHHPAAVGRAVTWSAVWAVHWRLARRRPATADSPALDLLFGSAVGLVLVGFGIGTSLSAALRLVYERSWLTTIVDTGSEPVVRAMVVAALGATVWWWYWLRHAAAAGRSPVRDAYVLLGGVLGGLIAAVVGAAQVLYAVLDWFFGDPGAPTAAAHFVSLPGAVGAATVGTLVWWYHRGVVAHQDTAGRSEVDRVYSYLGATVGLVTTAVAVTIAVSALLEALSGGRTLVDAGVADTVVLAVTLIAVGGPVWAAFWWRAQRFADEPAELHSVSRRVYLLLILGVAAIVALVALVVLLILFFEDLTEGVLGMDTLYRIRVPAGLVLSTGALAGYHAAVFRTDHRAAAAAPAAPAVPPTVAAGPAGPGPAATTAAGAPVLPAGSHLGEVIVIHEPGDHDAVLDALRPLLGVRVRSWPLAHPAGATAPALPDPVGLAQAVADASAAAPQATRLLVVLTSDGTELLPVLPAPADPLVPG